jgi:hypothetical protein
MMFEEVMGRYPPPMEEVLAVPPPGEQPVACLDLGCGSGCWCAFVCIGTFPHNADSTGRILDVARDFPHCSCVAVDLVPMQAV